MDELLHTNAFNLGKPTNTYGVQKELKRFSLKDHVNKESIILTDPDKDELLLEDDLINTNPSITVDPVQEARLDKSRYIKEKKLYVNIDSRNRKLYEKKLVPKNPNTKEYTRESFNPDTGECVIERYTADDLNLEYYSDHTNMDLNPIIDPFIQQNGEIFYKDPYDYEPNCYDVHFSKPFTNVKSVKLVSSEIPNPISTINCWNNLILIDIHDEDMGLTDEERCLGFSDSIPLKEECDGLPFFIIQIPIGNYGIEDLVDTIEDKVNKTVERRSFDSYLNLFKISYCKNTGKIEIKICPPEGKNLSFHWRFWFAPSIPKNRLLYWMLGFPRPFECNIDGSNKYVVMMNNLYNFGAKCSDIKNINVEKDAKNPKLSYALVHYGFKNIRPYRPVNLNPETYIYMVIEGFKTLLDTEMPSVDIFAKIQLPVPAGKTAFNTYINLPKFFLDTPLRSLEKITIKWIDSDGNLINWNGLEHSFTLEVTQYLDRLTVNDYSSVRGVVDPTSFTSKERIFAYTQ